MVEVLISDDGIVLRPDGYLNHSTLPPLSAALEAAVECVGREIRIDLGDATVSAAAVQCFLEADVSCSAEGLTLALVNVGEVNERTLSALHARHLIKD